MFSGGHAAGCLGYSATTPMSDVATRYRKAVVERALEGPGKAGGAARRAAFDNEGAPEPSRVLIDKVARGAWKVGDQDIAAVKAAGVSEDEIFELVVCAALGESTRQLESALAALDAALSARDAAKAGGR
jgi:hypothetical protein